MESRNGQRMMRSPSEGRRRDPSVCVAATVTPESRKGCAFLQAAFRGSGKAYGYIGTPTISSVSPSQSWESASITHHRLRDRCYEIAILGTYQTLKHFHDFHATLVQLRYSNSEETFKDSERICRGHQKVLPGANHPRSHAVVTT